MQNVFFPRHGHRVPTGQVLPLRVPAPNQHPRHIGIQLAHEPHEPRHEIRIQQGLFAGFHEHGAVVGVEDAGPARDEDELDDLEGELGEEVGEEREVEDCDAAGAEVRAEGVEGGGGEGELGEETEAVDGGFGLERVRDGGGEGDPLWVDGLVFCRKRWRS